MARFPGPPALGRGVVVGPGGAPPPEAATWRRVAVGDEQLLAPVAAADELHLAYARREPVVVELAADAEALRAPETCDLPPYRLTPAFDFARERLQYLVWSNNYDARDPDVEPIWWHGRRAVRLGAVADEGADVRLCDGEPAWCDGGPRGPVLASDRAALRVVHRETLEVGSLAPDHDAPSRSALADDQRRAVEHGAGAARIIAPAGSGKTRVLTERLHHLLFDRGVTPSSVLAVAFNKRAADELVERTAGLGAHTRTLNALGLAIVNGSAPFAQTGEPPRQMIDEREVRRLLQTLVKVRHQVNTDPWVPYLEALSAIRLGLADPGEVEEAIPDASGIAEVFDRYREILAEDALLDFDEQIYRAIELLLTRPDLRRHAQRHARHLLVDEFQDLNPAHLLLLRLLAAPGYDVFGVGDDDQVIYSYAGATPEYLIDYDRYFPGAAAYALETNYRCPPAVVAGAVNLLGHNRRRIPKEIVPATGRPMEASQLRIERAPAETHAEVASGEIRRLIDGGASPGDVAVLTRVNATLLPIQVRLLEQSVPCTTPLGPDVLARTGLRAALAYLRIGIDPDRIARADVAETIRRPSRKIARNVVELLQRRSTTSLRDIRSLAGALSGNDVERLERYAEDLELIAEAVDGGTTAKALAVVRTRIGLESAMDALDAAKRELDRSTHLDDLAALEQVAVLHPDPATFEPWLRAHLARRATPVAAGDERGDPELVTLSTVHRVKGQEWPHVIVLGASEGLMPHRLADDTEEERRIFHVAVTRCSADVVVLADGAKPSPFCAELSRPAPASAAPAGDRPGTETTLERLRRRGEAARPTAKAPGAPARQAVDPADEPLSTALRDWRRATAARDKVPAYVVLSDAHLEGIAAAHPATLAELARCRGIGPAKLEKYGDDILLVVEAAAG